MSLINSLKSVGKFIVIMLTYLSKFIPWVWRGLKASKVGVIFVVFADLLNKIGVRRATAYILVLGFAFKAVYRWLFIDQDFVLMTVTIARVLIAAEEQAVMYVDRLINDPQTFFSAIYLYMLILSSFFVFYYMYRFLIWLFKFVISDSSKDGMGPTILAISILLFLEMSFLGMNALATSCDGWYAITRENTYPFRGLRYLYSHITELPGIPLVYMDAPTNTTIVELANVTTVEKPRGLTTTLICAALPIC